MSDLQPFDFHGQSVRVVTDEQGEPWFVAVDVCRALDIANARDAVGRLAEDEVRTAPVGTTDGSGRALETNLVTEAGLYRLVFTSRRPEAESFRRWVTHDVLPAIRRTGSYSVVPQVALPTPRELAVMLIEAEDARVAAEARVAELEPRAEVADRLLNSDGDLSVGDTAKALTRAGVKVGADRLFRALGERKWLFRPADGRWRVYQSAIETGWMSVLPQSHYHPRTGVLVLDPPQPRVTPKGLQRLLLDHGVERPTAQAVVDELFPATAQAAS